MESTRTFKKNLESKKHREKKEIIKNKDIFNYKKDKKVSNKEKNKVVKVIKKKCGCGCGDIKTFDKKKY